MRWLAVVSLLSLVGCGGGSSHWNYSWVSDSGNLTIDASGDNEKAVAPRWDAYHYEQGDPQYGGVW